MRMMLRARLDTQLASEAVKSGRMPTIMQSLYERLSPEAAYYCPVEGARGCTFVFDMQDTSQIPSIAEPFFEELGAEIDITPVMNRDDLLQGLQTLEQG
ncbi:hypothetical protein E1265_14700 [Streptomyces sp. 8K308]|uniref:DUF3303 family protein n=1 Tax=Streptomyces sp. 8K308 TaxID=2530388 RepID=UPI0010445A35|nr:DUF3303 family protein [Streptomyces sp. 8K308]TDC22805.1 hypothetical protein E1265_14700 [Streptomyces sp. 8K308]